MRVLLFVEGKVGAFVDIPDISKVRIIPDEEHPRDFLDIVPDTVKAGIVRVDKHAKDDPSLMIEPVTTTSICLV